MAQQRSPATWELRVTRLIKAPREKAFPAWTEPEQIKQWWALGAGRTMDPGETRITVEFKDTGRAETKMTLVHQRLVSEKEKQRHGEGWNGCLDRMAKLVT